MKRTPRHAAERVLNIYREVHILTTPHAPFEPENSSDNAVILAVEYLREHKPDDDELATIEWLESIPGIASEMSKSYNNVLWVSADKFDCVCLKFIFMDDKTYEIMLEEWVIYQGPVPTRREVRNMLAVFGLKAKQ